MICKILEIGARKTNDKCLLQAISHLRTEALQKKIKARSSNPFTNQVYNPYPLQEENPAYKELYKEAKGKIINLPPDAEITIISVDQNSGKYYENTLPKRAVSKHWQPVKLKKDEID